MKSLNRTSAYLMIVVLATSCSYQPNPKTSSVASFDGTTIDYDLAGQGDPALVFVHCWTCDRKFWDEQFDYFGRQHKVVRLDLAGHGTSGKNRKQHSLAAFSQDVVAVIDKLNLNQIILVGHSMGGPVSVETATQLNDRVIGVVAVDSFYTSFVAPTTDEEAAALMKPFEDDFFGTNKKSLETTFHESADPAKKAKIIGKFMQADETLAIQALHEIVRWYRFDADKRLTLIDKRLRNINADLQGDQKPSRENIVLIQGVGHFIPQMKPVAFNQALEKAVSNLINKKVR